MRHRLPCSCINRQKALANGHIARRLPVVIHNVESSNRKQCGGQRFRVCYTYNIIALSTVRERARERERSLSNINICVRGVRASELSAELCWAVQQSSVFVSLSNIHICIYGVKARELPAELFWAVEQGSSVFVSLSNIHIMYLRFKGERIESGVILIREQRRIASRFMLGCQHNDPVSYSFSETTMDPEAREWRTTTPACQFGWVWRNTIAVPGATIRHIVWKNDECSLWQWWPRL